MADILIKYTLINLALGLLLSSFGYIYMVTDGVINEVAVMSFAMGVIMLSCAWASFPTYMKVKRNKPNLKQ